MSVSFYSCLSELIAFNLSAVELTPQHVLSYKTRSVSCFKIISLENFMLNNLAI